MGLSCCPCFDNKGAEYVALSSQHGSSSGSTARDEHSKGSADATVLPSVALPTWVPDEAVVKCYGCSGVFDLMKRKHHCRRCRNIFCGSCTPSEVEKPMRLIGRADPVRLCRQCSLMLPNENEFIEHYLPILSQGGRFFVTKGILYSKVAVNMSLSKDFRSMEWGEAGSVDKSSIAIGQIGQVVEEGNTGLRIVTSDNKTHRFDCQGQMERYDWIKALRSATKCLPQMGELKTRVEQEREQRALQEQMALADKARKENHQKRKEEKAKTRADLAKKYGLPNRG